MKPRLKTIFTSIPFAAALFITSALSMFSCNSGDKEQYVLIETDFGNMKAKLFNDTPQHRDNFIKLVKENYYDGLTFHRVINGFMIQGGDPNSRNAEIGAPLGAGGPGYQVPAEIGKPHFKGALAAARNNNPEKASSGSQFYIVQGRDVNEQVLNSMATQKGITYTDEQRKKYMQYGGTPQLDNEYTVFGEVVEGLDVIDKIAAVQTAAADRPVQDVTMKIKLVD